MLRLFQYCALIIFLSSCGTFQYQRKLSFVKNKTDKIELIDKESKEQLVIQTTANDSLEIAQDDIALYTSDVQEEIPEEIKLQIHEKTEQRTPKRQNDVTPEEAQKINEAYLNETYSGKSLGWSIPGLVLFFLLPLNIICITLSWINIFRANKLRYNTENGRKMFIAGFIINAISTLFILLGIILAIILIILLL